MDHDKKLSELGEDYIVDRILEWIEGYYPRDSKIPLGDDAYDIPASNLIMSIDGYSLRYSKYEWENWSDWGWRAVTSAVSDLICKGARPYGVSISLGLNSGYSFRVIRDLYSGILEAVKHYGIYLLGGDTNASVEEGWITVSAIGIKGDKVLTRFGASVGDYIYTTLENGYGLSGLIWNLYKKYGVSPRESIGIDLRLRPRSPLRFVELIPEIQISSSIDVSDGLAKSLYILAERNGVSINIDRIPDPNPFVRDIAPKEGIDIDKCVLYGGEDYEVIFTSPINPETVLEVSSSIGLKVIYIGRVIEGSGDVFYRGKLIEYGGWDQFKSI